MDCFTVKTNLLIAPPRVIILLMTDKLKMDVTPYKEFARERLGFDFHDISLLVTALTHRSYVNEHRETAGEHNERLEFLGDAVLEVVVSDYIYRNFREPEGTMTSWRSTLVRTESIGRAGDELGYGPLVRMSKGERMGSNRARAAIMADCFEALIGAIYLDQGFRKAREFIYIHILVHMDEIIQRDSWRDPKSHFQELSQHFDGVPPQYRVLKEEGPDHNKIFTVAAYINGEVVALGNGHSKQEAQVACAEKAIAYYHEIHADELPRHQAPELLCPDWLNGAYPG